ncbi:MraY-like glycosyltransferase [Stieleria maiorica]|uniref:MraY-like glycosyltransferase n=1 Tax=Stieleria maiorica TaxID=2795974 RepID=A0A5B9MCQ8_9BACT|nr:hypothetical protein [Stieleria maiorica]QEF99121.1 MraY-like glycosyltransferase [Stieleria maiorica]
MWTILAEKPLLISIMVGGVVAGLLYGWLQTGNKRLGVASLATALLIPVSFYVADSIVTDREKILQAIYATAEAVEQNDHESAVIHIADRATRQRALSELPNYEFHRIGVRNIQINMVTGSLPPEATVDLDASVTASMNRGGVRNIRVPRRVVLTFQQQPDGEWMVTDYTHMPLTGGADGFTPNRI